MQNTCPHQLFCPPRPVFDPFRYMKIGKLTSETRKTGFDPKKPRNFHFFPLFSMFFRFRLDSPHKSKFRRFFDQKTSTFLTPFFDRFFVTFFVKNLTFFRLKNVCFFDHFFQSIFHPLFYQNFATFFIKKLRFFHPKSRFIL